MKRYRLWLEKLYDRKIQQEWDRVVPVVADEGMGKSTLMLETAWEWQKIRGLDPTPESVLEKVVWDQEGFRSAISNYERQSIIPVMDAARVLHKREVMQPNQIELEKDLLDVRTKEYVILLGFQDWDIIPTSLQQRRAKNLIRIPSRGQLEGYSRSSIDDLVEYGDWPEPDLVDRFPSLDGTDMWEEFQRRDIEQKNQRMAPDVEDDTDEEKTPQEVAEEIIKNGIEDYVTENPVNKRRYLDADLIEADYGLSARKSTQVKKLVAREVDIPDKSDKSEVTA